MLICYVAADAQTVGVAVLSHNNESTMFYGNTALQQAVDAATEGDVITLSPGTFVGFDSFSKSGLTIIGSGMGEGPSQTILTGFTVQSKHNKDNFVKLTLKNVYIASIFSSYSGNCELKLEKCRVHEAFRCANSTSERGFIELVDCENARENVLAGCEDDFSNVELRAYNCILKPKYLGKDNERERILTNCIIWCTPDGGTASIHNSIIFEKDNKVLSSSLRATNCKAIGGNIYYFGTQAITNERLDYNFQAFVESSFYELLPELAGTWVDEHGSQIGIYGGPKPFSVLPDAPRFTKFNVPAKTDADGHLKVEIEVAMPEK